MRLPLPANRIVALTLLGALLTTVVAGALATPGILSPPDDGAATVNADTPTPNGSFTPAASSAGSNGQSEEHESDEHESGEHESGEHEDEYLDALDAP